MTNKKLLLWILLLPVTLFSQNGGDPGAFLRRDVGSRALALGGAFTSVANDASAMYWNPAGLSETKNIELLGMYSLLPFDRQHFFTSAVVNFSDLFSMGASWIRYNVNNIDGRDMSGNQTEKFSDDENCFSLAVNKKFGSISFGATGKYFYHSMYYSSADGMSCDFGLLIFLYKGINFGFVLQDNFGKLNWKNGFKEELPVIMRGGISYQSDFVPVLVSIEVQKKYRQWESPGYFWKAGFYKAGIEYKIIEYFGIRAGYNGYNPTFGGFIKVNSSRNFITQLDYAGTFERLDNSIIHNIGLRICF